ncbi:MAG: restriction endonuclease subunit S [Burkholderiales bacterium]|nr:restriction endonuclease subunit S [Burkholderiales bacterium]
MSIPAIDIRPDHWQIVRHILRLRVPHYAVWAFGSRVKWTAKPHSDLDLAIITDKPLPLSVSAALANDFSESNLPWMVDVVDWAATSDSFRKVIERDKVLVQEPTPPSDSDMGSDWPIFRIEDIAEKIAMGPFGSNIKVETFVKTGVPVISGAHLRGIRLEDSDFNFVTEEHAERMKNSNVFRGDVIFTHAGNIGQIAYIPPNSQYERYVISQRQFYLRCNLSKADPVFISYYFHSDEGQHKLLANASQTGVPSIARPSSYLKTIELQLPPLEEQRAIANTLGALDDRIDNLHQTNATLEIIAAALFKSWFVDFDGVAPENMQESELGLIPKGWRVGTLDEVFEINPKRELKKSTIAPYLDMASVPTAGAVPDAPMMREFSSGTKFANGDTLLARITPCLENGKTAFVNFLEKSQVGWGSTEFIVLRPKLPLPPFFGYILARREDFRAHAIQAMSGTSGRQRVEVGQLQNFKLAIPDETTARAFADLVEPVQKALFDNLAQATTLDELRDTLLPKLISGQLRTHTAGTK